MSEKYSSRNFLCTLNNPSFYDDHFNHISFYGQLQPLEDCPLIDEIYAQYEQGTTVHIQFAVSFIEPCEINFNILKSLIPNAHIEGAKKPWIACKRYCQKEDDTFMSHIPRYSYKTHRTIIRCPSNYLPETVYCYPDNFNCQKSTYRQPDLPEDTTQRIMCHGNTIMFKFKYLFVPE